MEEIKKILIKDVPTPECHMGEVLVKVEVCGICRTDMKAFYQGQRDLHIPRILGHEIAGIVVETGGGVDCVKPGDRVQVAPGLSCGICRYCLRGEDHLCDSVRIMGFHCDGGFAEYVLVPANGVKNGVLSIIPDHLSLDDSVLAEPLACCVNMQDSMQVGSGDTVAIFGAGPLGLLNAQLARAKEASLLILIEINTTRLHSVFDYCLNPFEVNPLSAVRDITDGKGVDAVILCCPAPETIGSGLAMLAKRGRLGLFSGLINKSRTGTLDDFNLVHYKELSIFGAYGCSSQHNKTALGLLATGVIKVRNIITRSITLDETLSGLEAVKAMTELKVVIKY